MRRIAAILAAVAALPAAAGAQTARPQPPPSSPQILFRDLIAGDTRGTTRGIRSGLRARRLFVQPDVLFADLTGDGKPDAIARVSTGGAQGDVAVYVFSVDGVKPDAQGKAQLRAIYRNQALYRASARVTDATLFVRSAQYREGNEPCCPSQLLERTLTWSARVQRLVLRSSRRLDVPVQAVGTTR